MRQKETSKRNPRIEDQYLPNGSIIYWSRRQSSRVPVRCGKCGEERLIADCIDQNFTGLCADCANRSQRTHIQSATQNLPTGSIVCWPEEFFDPAYRHGTRMVPVVCGLCGDERAVPVYTAAKEDFTGFCVRCGNSGQQSWRWKGGRKRNRDGYIMVKLPHYHPFYSMANKDGYVMEHRLVVAEHLGRPLLDNEIVHHLNRIRDDNRLENLQLLVEHHPGYLPLSSDEQD